MPTPRCFALLLIALASLGQAAAQSSSPGDRGGLVVSQNVLASQVGAWALGRGGNAVDAAVATAFALAVVHPSAGNVGGGGFLVFRDGKGVATTFDFRECAPAAATPDMFLDARGNYDEKRHHEHILAVGVPGTPAGLWLAHARLGRLPWGELVEPARLLALQGFLVTERLAKDLAALEKAFAAHPQSARNYYGEDLRPPRRGEILRLPDLALTLERIRDLGRDGFYRGRTADLIVDQMRRDGGLIGHADLQGYRAIERPALVGRYRGLEVVGMGPPSSGGITLLNMLHMLEARPRPTDATARRHLMVETMRRAYADRARFLGDPAGLPRGTVERLADPERARARIADFDAARATRSRLEDVLDPPDESDQTTHLSVVDSEGAAVALTYTLENAYGSKIVVDGAGFLLNDEMGDFNPKAFLTDEKGRIGTPFNLARPGRRMLSSMTPTIVAGADGKTLLVLGSPGGRTIINTVYEILTGVVDEGLGIQAAVDRGRFHHQWFPDEIVVEERALDEVPARSLEALGHRLKPVEVIGTAACIAAGRDATGAPCWVPGVDRRHPDSGAAGSTR